MTEIIDLERFTDKQLENIAVAIREEQKRRKEATLARLQEDAIRALKEYFDAGGELRVDDEMVCDWSSGVGAGVSVYVIEC